MIDLHIHTIASSDGQHTPGEIFAMAKDAGLTAIAFADHNSIGSVGEGVSLAAMTETPIHGIRIATPPAAGTA